MSPAICNHTIRSIFSEFVKQLLDQQLDAPLTRSDHVEMATTDLALFLRNHFARPEYRGRLCPQRLSAGNFKHAVSHDCELQRILERLRGDRLRQKHQAVETRFLRVVK